MEIRQDILNEILQRKSQKGKKGEKREKLLKLKDEILALKERGLSTTDIVEYLKKAHRLRVNVSYLRKVIPELADKPGVIVNVIGRNEPAEKVIEHLIEAAKRLGVSERKFAEELLNRLPEDQKRELCGQSRRGFF